MLSFAPPLRLIAGHPVFADHQDAGLFHVLPDHPGLAETAGGLPAFALTRFLGDAADGGVLAGGFLSVGARLPLPQARIDLIRQRLADELGRPVRLSPALFDEGRVELILLGQTGQAPAAGTSPFAVTTLGSGLPSMAGENTAAFQVQLNQAAAAFVEGCLTDATLPALVIYRMALAGVQPAYSIRITGDWRSLKQEMDSRFHANLYYLRADVERMTRDSLTAAGIRAETVIMDGAAAEDAAAAERAMLDWITGTFFNPAHGTRPPEPGLGVVDAVKGTVLDLIDTLMPGASFTLKEVSEAELRQLEVALDRTVVRRRELVFQSALGADLQALRLDPQGVERPGWPALRDRMVTGVNIRGIERREVQISLLDRFASDGLATVEVEIALPDPVTGADLHGETFVFHAAVPAPPGGRLWAVNLLGAPQALLTAPFRYRLRVHYDPGAGFGEHLSETGPWLSTQVTDLRIDPRSDGPYRLRQPVIGAAPGFPFAQFAEVAVDLRVEGPPGQFDQSATLRLTATAPEAAWPFRGHGPTPARFEWRAVFDRPMASGGPVETDWAATDALRLTLPDPLPHRRRATFFVTLPWEEVTLAFLEVRSADPTVSGAIDERIALSREVMIVERDYAVADRADMALSYRLTAFVIGRGLVQGDWRDTTDTTIPLGRELFEKRAIRFRAIGLPLSAHGLAELTLRGEALAPDGAILHEHRAQRLADETGADLGTWTFPRLSPTVARLRLRADWRDANGFPGDTGWLDWSRDLALFRLPQKAFLP